MCLRHDAKHYAPLPLLRPPTEKHPSYDILNAYNGNSFRLGMSLGSFMLLGRHGKHMFDFSSSGPHSQQRGT